MAEKRMFSKSVIDSDLFLDMPLATQALYFHLAMRADDDGFVGNPKKIVRMVNAAEDSLKLLAAKQFILPFDSGIVVIRHWWVHNYIQASRKKDTVYADEKALLTQNSIGAYEMLANCQQNANKMLADDEQMLTQIRIDKNRLDQNRIEEKRIETAELPTSRPKREKFIAPTVEEVRAYCTEKGKPIDAEAFIDYYTSNGWKVGKNPMKDWKSAVNAWRRRDEQNGKVYKEPVIDHSLDFIFGND